MAILEEPPGLTPRTEGEHGYRQAKKSDPDCFALYADKTGPEVVDCVLCEKRGEYGSLIETHPSSMSKAICLFEFLCKDHRDPSRQTAVTASIMFPSWRLIAKVAKGRFWFRHLSEREKVARFT